MVNKKTIGFMGGKFLPLHQGHIYVILAASNQVDELYVVVSSSENRDRELCEKDGIKYIPADVRLSWLGEALNDLDNIKIIHIEDDHWDSDYDWKEGADMIKKAIGKPIDYVFSSEKEYGKLFEKYYPDSEHIVVDDKRKTVAISATELRKDLYGNWDKLPNCVKPYFVKKVAVVGTESCGKTTLCKKLAKFYNTKYVHEIGRDYCERHSNLLTADMFDKIAMEHFILQDKKARGSDKVLFVDSDAVITRYYLDMYFSGNKSRLIEEIAALQNYDLVIFLEPDVEWVSDGLRFAGEGRQRLENNKLLKDMYEGIGVDFVSVGGNYNERFMKVKDLVDGVLKNGV